MSMVYKTKRYVGFMSLVVFLLILSTEARADLYTYGFGNITNNDVADAAIGESQLSVGVDNPGGDQVLFTFYNTAIQPCSITDVYVDDGALLDAPIDDLVGSSGVSFSQPANPETLPGGNAIDPEFVTSAGLSADADPSPFHNGVNASGEYLKVYFDLKSGITFDDVIDAINVGFNPDNPDYYDGESWLELNLRIGIHVQGFDGGGSESLVMTPEPGSLLLGSIGIGMVIARCRKRKTLNES